jgi:small subunit ribosomal protein S20
MPNIKSAEKRVRKSTAKRLQNRIKKSDLKTTIRKFYSALESNAPEKQELLKLAIKKIDKAAAKNLVHKNTASRRKSQLQKAYNAAISD